MRPLTLAPRVRWPEIGVHLVGEVQRRAAHRHIDDLALGREHVDPVLEQIHAHAVEKVARRVAAFGGRQQRAQLIDLALVGLVAAAAFLVAPVRGHAALGVGMHFVRADLDLDRLRRRDRGRPCGSSGSRLSFGVAM